MLRFLILSLFFISSFSKGYEAVQELDLDKYIGKWYQVYENKFDKTFQGNSRCSVAHYKMNSNNISVLNSQINYDGDIEKINGFAYYKDDNSGGYLTVKLEDNPEAPYWVIELGPVVNNMYDYSIVSDNLKLSLFVLARNVTEYYNLYDDKVLESLNNFGFTNFLNKPIRMIQDC